MTWVAMVAARSHCQFKAFDQRLRLAAKPARLTLTAMIGKLLVLMNRILKNPNFDFSN